MTGVQTCALPICKAPWYQKGTIQIHLKGGKVVFQETPTIKVPWITKVKTKGIKSLKAFGKSPKYKPSKGYLGILEKRGRFEIIGGKKVKLVGEPRKFGDIDPVTRLFEPKATLAKQYAKLKIKADVHQEAFYFGKETYHPFKLKWIKTKATTGYGMTPKEVPIKVPGLYESAGRAFEGAWKFGKITKSMEKEGAMRLLGGKTGFYRAQKDLQIGRAHV